MNCKLGDLAIVVHGQNVGRLVSVIDPSIYGPLYWFVECLGRPISGIACNILMDSQRTNILDAWLRPIQNGGELDETLRQKPKQQPSTALCGNRAI